MGSKSRIAKHIVPIIQQEIDQSGRPYVEPFVGGANIIDKINASVRLGLDKNVYLISLFQYLQEGGELPESVSFEEYSQVRADNAAYPEWYVGCVGFLASYNGRFFDGGYANAGYEGTRYRDYYAEARRNILQQVQKLNDIEFICLDYRYSDSANCFDDCVIYCDPPYENVKKYANSANFDHLEFWEIMRRWSENNTVIISEESAPPDFECIWEQEVSRSIKATGKSRAIEKLFRYAK